MAPPLSPAPGRNSGADGTRRPALARLSLLRRPAALAALACFGLAACAGNLTPGAGGTHTVTVQPGSATPAGGATPTTAPASQAAAGGNCLATNLKGSPASWDGAAGTFYQEIVLTNTSAASCTLYGYPGVSFVTGAGGSQVGAAANRDSFWPPIRVTLAPGGQANFRIALTDSAVYPSAQCEPTKVTWLRVYPPGDYGSILLQDPTTTCAVTTNVVLRATSVQEGAVGPGA